MAIIVPLSRCLILVNAAYLMFIAEDGKFTGNFAGDLVVFLLLVGLEVFSIRLQYDKISVLGILCIPIRPVTETVAAILGAISLFKNKWEVNTLEDPAEEPTFALRAFSFFFHITTTSPEKKASSEIYTRGYTKIASEDERALYNKLERAFVFCRAHDYLDGHGVHWEEPTPYLMMDFYGSPSNTVRIRGNIHYYAGKTELENGVANQLSGNRMRAENKILNTAQGILSKSDKKWNVEVDIGLKITER